MDGFKDSTRMKYMTEGGTYNERGRRATMSEIAAEDRRMARRPSEGVSSRPTDASGRRATDAELGMTSSAKKPVGPSSVAVSKVLAGMTKPMKKATGGSVSEKPQISGGPITNPNRTLGDTLGKASATTAAQLATKGPHPIYAIAARQKQLQDSGQDRHTLNKTAAKVPPPKTLVKPGPTPPQPTPNVPPPMNVTKPDNWFIPGKNGSSGGLSSEYMDYFRKREEAEYQARIASGDYPDAKKPASNSPAPTAVRKLVEQPITKGGGTGMPPAPAGFGDAYRKAEEAHYNAAAESGRRKQPAPQGYTPNPNQVLPPAPSYMKKGGMAKKGVPAYSGKPMIGRKASGLAVMPKGKR